MTKKVLSVNLRSPIIINHLRIMSFYSCEVDFSQMLSYEAKERFYPNRQDLSIKERFFCCEYARFKMGKACFQFVSLIEEIGETKLAQEMTDVSKYKYIKSYSSEKELFREILRMHMDLEMFTESQNRRRWP